MVQTRSRMRRCPNTPRNSKLSWKCQAKNGIIWRPMSSRASRNKASRRPCRIWIGFMIFKRRYRWLSVATRPAQSFTKTRTATAVIMKSRADSASRCIILAKSLASETHLTIQLETKLRKMMVKNSRKAISVSWPCQSHAAERAAAQFTTQCCITSDLIKNS